MAISSGRHGSVPCVAHVPSPAKQNLPISSTAVASRYSPYREKSVARQRFLSLFVLRGCLWVIEERATREHNLHPRNNEQTTVSSSPVLALGEGPSPRLCCCSALPTCANRRGQERPEKKKAILVAEISWKNNTPQMASSRLT